MLAEKIENATNALSEMAGRVDQDQWNRLRRIQAELRDAAQVAWHLETRMTSLDNPSADE